MVEPISGTFVLTILALTLFFLFAANCARVARQRRAKRWRKRR